MLKRSLFIGFLFIAAFILNGCEISGNVSTSEGDPLKGVKITLSGDKSATTYTDDSGNFSFDVPDKYGSYTITPSYSGWQFTPESRSARIKSGTSSSGIDGIDFVLILNTTTALVPKTGQTTSYTNGDDGDLQAGVSESAARFTDNMDGTITDNRSGLIWLKNANTADYKLTWVNALAAVDEINASGTMNNRGAGDTSNAGSHQTDWRLPNIKELQSLVDLGTTNPALPDSTVFTDLQYYATSDLYWSGTTTAGYVTSRAWALSIKTGSAENLSKPESCFVWPVRGGLVSETNAYTAKTGQTVSYATGDDGDLEKGAAVAGERFTDNGDGTVTDNLTRLIWLKKTDIIPDGHSWEDALNDISELNTSGSMAGVDSGDTSNNGGHQTDWRLPNLKELQSLTDLGQINPAMPVNQPFEGVNGLKFWSGTTCAFSTGSAWMIQMASGLESYEDKSVSGCVWPVRGNPTD